MKAKEKKAQQVTDISNLLSASAWFIIFDYTTMSAVEATSMRKKLFKNESKMKIIKNNILRRALQAGKFEGIEESVIKGKLAVAFGKNEIFETLKIIDTVIKTKESMNFIFGFSDKRGFDGKELQKMATLPGRNELYGMFLSVLQAPLRKFLYALDAVKSTK